LQRVLNANRTTRITVASSRFVVVLIGHKMPAGDVNSGYAKCVSGARILRIQYRQTHLNTYTHRYTDTRTRTHSRQRCFSQEFVDVAAVVFSLFI